MGRREERREPMDESNGEAGVQRSEETLRRENTITEAEWRDFLELVRALYLIEDRGVEGLY